LLAALKPKLASLLLSADSASPIRPNPLLLGETLALLLD
jgi:hypothetical protein